MKTMSPKVKTSTANQIEGKPFSKLHSLFISKELDLDTFSFSYSLNLDSSFFLLIIACFMSILLSI